MLSQLSVPTWAEEKAVNLCSSHLTQSAGRSNKAMRLPLVLFKNFPLTLLRESSLLDASLTVQSDRQKHVHTHSQTDSRTCEEEVSTKKSGWFHRLLSCVIC